MATVDFDPEDYLDEVDTECLINELKSRKVLPPSFKYDEDKHDLTSWGKNPKRDLLLSHLDISPLSDLNETIEKVKEVFNK